MGTTTIWKFELETTDNQEVEMPVGTENLQKLRPL